MSSYFVAKNTAKVKKPAVNSASASIAAPVFNVKENI